MQERMPTFATYNFFTGLFLAVLLGVSACTVKLVSSYDEATDKAVTDLQRKVETFLVDLGSQARSPKCGYNNHKAFYRDVKIDLSAIEVRAAALSQNDLTVEQLRLLEDSLNKLEQLHKIGCPSTEQLNALRTAFNSSFTAILKLELAKKRGATK
jgi:hypothetical protein